jgi:hypothetical protein
MIQSLKTTHGTDIPAEAYANSHRPIMSGHTFYVKLESRDRNRRRPDPHNNPVGLFFSGFKNCPQPNQECSEKTAESDTTHQESD